LVASRGGIRLAGDDMTARVARYGTHVPNGRPVVFETATPSPARQDWRKTIRELTLVRTGGHAMESGIAGASVLARDAFVPDVVRPPERFEPPALHPDLVKRSALLNWFSAHRGEPVVTVFAPAGYGKTTVVGQAAEADERPVAWVSLRAADNDPVALVNHIALGLDRIAKVGPDMVRALRSPTGVLGSWTLRGLGAAFASIQAGAILVLDDVHLLHDPACLDVVTALCASVPQGSQLMLAGRTEPDLGLPRVRAERRLAELSHNELAFVAAEAGELLRAAGVNATESEVAELTRLTEGWPAALYLAALALRGRGSGESVSASVGQNGDIASYLRSEILQRMAPEQVEFLTRTAVLEWMSGPLCDAVLKQIGGAATLESLSRSNRFLVAVDGGLGRFRYHHLFRAVLAAELERREPGAVAMLNRRAADWCESNGMPAAAIEYAFAGDDLEQAARLVTGCALEVYESGAVATVQGWIERLDQAGVLERYPAIAVLAAWIQGCSGQPARAERLASAAEWASSEGPLVDGSPTIEPWLATLRAGLCRHGEKQMRTDAERALELAPEWSFWQPSASLSLAVSFLLAGDDDRADEVFADTVELARERGTNDVHSIALAERSLLAAARGDVRSAEQFAQDARCVVVDCGLDAYMTSAITYAALGRAALERRDLAKAREHLRHADGLRPLLTRFMPYLGVQVRFELVGERLASADPAGARVLLREIDHLLRRVPALGVLVKQAVELRGQVDAMRRLSGDAGPLLTDAELRVLPLLATHLSIGEIAQRQFVSRATVKTQSISIYRKLGVKSRSEAVEHAAEMGLIELAVVPTRREFV
jgi:LuxR family transcriptional regulator, maltose regulon positive regulatory protein